jgi:hypothetical protein
MASITPINIGAAPNDGTGDPLRDAFDQINQNEAALNAEHTTIIASLVTVGLQPAQSSSYTIVLAALTKLESIDFKYVSGSPQVSVGTTSGGIDLAPSGAVSSGNIRNCLIMRSWVGSQTIYITITGGTVDVERYYRPSRFTP